MQHGLVPSLEFGVEFVVIAVMAFGLLKWGMLQMLKQANEALQIVVKTQHDRITSLMESVSFQADRILKLEVDNEEKTRLLHDRQKEIQILEETVEMAFTGLLKVNKSVEAKTITDNIAGRLAELREFRRTSNEANQEWAERTRVILIHTSSHPAHRNSSDNSTGKSMSETIRDA
jgi:hypothetical protein